MPGKIKLVGVCDINDVNCQKAKEQVEPEMVTTRWQELVEHKEIDIIDCSVPNVFHKDILIAAIQAGKHVYSEKPLALNLAEAREIYAVAEKSNVIHQMTFEYRFIPAMLRAKQLIEDGFLGRPFHFRSVYLHAGYVDATRPISWRLDKKQGGGGALYDIGSHALDLVRFLLGDTGSVYAHSVTFIPERPFEHEPLKKGKVEVDDLTLMLLKMESGCVGTVEASRVATGANDELRLEIHGEKGALRFNLMEPNWLEIYDRRDPENPIGGNRGFKKIETVQRYPKPAVLPSPKFSVGWMRFHVASQFDFLQRIAEGRQGSPSFYDGLRIQEIMEAGYRASEIKQWVNLPLP